MNRKKCAEVLAMVETHGAVMRAYSQGAKVQVQTFAGEGMWYDTEPPMFSIESGYRVKPAEPALDIPWDRIPENYICAAMDKSGMGYLYTKPPKLNELSDVWVSLSTPCATLPLLNLNPRNVPWDKTLTYRPGFEPKE